MITQPLSLLFAQSWQVYAYAFAMALISTVFPVFLLGLAIRFIGAARASMVGMLGPVLTIFLGWMVLNEPLSIWQIAGACLLILCIDQKLISKPVMRKLRCKPQKLLP